MLVGSVGRIVGGAVVGGAVVGGAVVGGAVVGGAVVGAADVGGGAGLVAVVAGVVGAPAVWLGFAAVVV
jgi:hypothetical protein